MTQRWLVTGGAGFIGSHLVERLIECGHAVTVLDNFSSGSPENLAAVSQSARLSIIRGDVRVIEDIEAALSGVSGVYHCAATAGVQYCIEDWLGAHQVNATATIRLFDAVHRFGAVPVVYASSAAVYGDRSDEVCHEELTERPISPYGTDKLTCENQARAFWSVHGLASAGLRFFNVYGPRQFGGSPYSGVLARFSASRLTGRTPVIYGDGMQSRDFIHVSDVITGMVEAMELLCAAPQCLVSNVCTGRSVSLLELLTVVDAVLSSDFPRPEFQATKRGDIRHSRGDAARMIRWLRIGKTLPLESGVRDYLQWLGANPSDIIAPRTVRPAAE